MCYVLPYYALQFKEYRGFLFKCCICGEHSYISLVWAICSKEVRFAVRGENDYTQQYAEIFDYLKENTGAKEPIFTFADGKFAYDLQTGLVDRVVTCIDADRISYIMDSQYLVLPEQEYSDFEYSQYMNCLQTQGVMILQKKEN